MGRLLALQLCNAGYRVTLFDKDPIKSGGAAAYTAAGMLTPYTEVTSSEDHIYTLGKKSLALWPRIIKQLGNNIEYHDKGSLIIAHPNDRSDHIRFKNHLADKLSTKANECKHLNSEELCELEPALNENFSEAIHLPNEAWLNTEQIMQSLAQILLQKNIVWHTHSHVTETQEHQLTYGNQRYQFDTVIDCRGLGARTELPELRGVRGELIWVEAKEVELSHLVRLIHPRYCLYLVPRKHNHYIIGATQIESDDLGPMSVRSALELLSALYSIHPGFAEARIIETRTNCRPALKNNLPVIQHQKGLVRVNGLFRHGFLLAPVISQEVCRWLPDGQHYHSSFQHLFKETA